MKLATNLLVLLVALLLSACGAAQPSTVGVPANSAPPAPTEAAVTGGMDHGTMPMGDSDAPYDAQFIDSMIVHHQGAIEMAQQALTESQREEIRMLAQKIISTQTAEIEQLEQWRAAWYPDLAQTQGLSMDMGEDEISGDAGTPFDLRFIKAMIDHHEGAIAMAKDAEQKAEHAEIKNLAAAIISAQELEATQMQQWQEEWFGQ